MIFKLLFNANNPALITAKIPSASVLITSRLSTRI
ncbi:hypothetical protein BAZSYMA_ACONTIG284061_0 [Bathymodiolus azoricus thioautotrophic gill symbiont]|uniref:Uncharacterized protein n=1 Tax=Bathymodiolus azoricus thioautotrophic gill symbiont TaxID=235205 RepID=A0A1H6JWF8_9GAMM|nr:hypothetical protein BAZSYMA_ACONTIG284061_0 [Bathymodiolus azoricus thioautotrophic gill symbiont]